MSRHDPMVRLRHMLSHAREAVSITQGKVRADLNSDRQLNLALVRLLEIVGEAAARARRKSVRNIREFRSWTLSVYATDSSTAMITWTSTSCGRSSSRIYRCSFRPWKAWWKVTEALNRELSVAPGRTGPLGGT